MKKLKAWRLLAVTVPLFLLLYGCEKPEGGGKATQTGMSQMPRPAIPFNQKLYDVTITESGGIWVCGYFGALYHSPDGGITWTKKDAGTTEGFLGIDFVGDKLGWIVGGNGIILHTKDGGETWERQVNPREEERLAYMAKRDPTDDSVPDIQEQRLFKVFFSDENNGWTVGEWGVILHTADGGNTWVRQDFYEDAHLFDIYFLNNQEGWIVGEFEFIIHTTDGGQTWEAQREWGEVKISSVSFRDSMHGVAVGVRGMVLITEDAGVNWNKVTPPMDETYQRVAFVPNTERVIAVGQRGAAMRSEDSGKTWSVFTLPNMYSWVSGLAFAENGDGYAVGDQGTIFISKDSGKSWVPYFQLKK